MKPLRRLIALLAMLALLITMQTAVRAQPLPTPSGRPTVNASPAHPTEGAPGESSPGGSDARPPSPQEVPASPAAPAAGTPPSGAPSTEPLSPHEGSNDPETLVERQGGMRVRVLGQEAFYLYHAFRGQTLAGRVAGVERRITQVLERPDFDPDLLKVVEDSRTTSATVLYDNRFLFGILPDDTPFEGASPQIFALRYIERLRTIYRSLAQQRTQEMEKRAVTVALEGLVAFPLSLLLCLLVLRLVEKRIHAMEGRLIKPLRVQQAVILDSPSILAAIVLALRFALFMAMAVVFLVYLDYLLSFLPGTTELRKTLLSQPLDYLKSLVAASIRFIPNLLFLACCAFLTRLLLGLNDTLFDAMVADAIVVHSSYKDFLPIYRKLARATILFFGLVLMLPNLPGYDLPIFKGLSIFAGLIISIGSVGAMSNAFAGFSLLLSRGLKEGDRIKVGEHVGDVMEMTLSTTRIRTIAKQDLILPNSYLLQNGLLNLTSPVKEAGSTIIYIAVTIGYDAHGDVVESLLCKAAHATDGVTADPAPFVLQKSLDDFYVTYHLGAHTRVPEQMLRIVSDLNRNIRRFFDEGGVEIMSPHYSSLRDGNCIAIPERYLASSYEAPTFRLEACVKPARQSPGAGPSSSPRQGD